MNVTSTPAWLRWIVAVAFGLTWLVHAGATTVVPPDFDQLVNESDYIVRAVVKSVTSEWREQGGSRHIFTLVTLDVSEVIKGTPPQPLVLQMLGGKVGQDEMAIAGAPKFEVGQEDILFVKGNGRNVFPLFGIMHGRYPILKEAGTGRKYVARNNQMPLSDTAEVAQPMTDGSAAQVQQRMKNTDSALTPDQFTQRIKSAVDSSYRHAQPN